MLDVVMAKLKFILHIVGGAILLLQSLIRSSKGTMFARSDLDIAQSPSIDLLRSISFGKVGWQSCNVPTGRMIISFNTDVVYVPHHVLQNSRIYLCMPFSPSIWAKN